MRERGFGEVGFDFGDEFISEFFAAGVTATAFTGIRDEDAMPGVVWTLIGMITKFFWVTAGEHFFYSVDDMEGKVLVGGDKIWPVFFKDLLDGGLGSSHQGVLWR